MKIVHPLWRLGVYLEHRAEHVGEWHRYFAWLPVVVREQKHESIKVPCHYVWLEPVDRRRDPEFHAEPLLFMLFLQLLSPLFPGAKWQFRPYTNSPKLGEERNPAKVESNYAGVGVGGW